MRKENQREKNSNQTITILNNEELVLSSAEMEIIEYNYELKSGHNNHVFNIEDESIYLEDSILFKLDTFVFENAEDITNDLGVINAKTKGEGLIVLEDLKLDLSRFLFGTFPVIEKVCFNIFK